MTTLQEDIAALNAETSLPEEVVYVIEESIRMGQESPVQGIEEGETAPDFTLPDEKGNSVNLATLLKNGPVVISFQRGDWCQYCSLELQALQKHHQDLVATGGQLVCIHPQTEVQGEGLAAKYNLSFPMLADQDQSVMTAYNVRFEILPSVKELYTAFNLDLEALNANGRWNLPVPATFIINTDGTVVKRHFDHNFMERMEPTEIIKVLQGL
ncbi:MAG TPA: alkyl hydroperoxide reductase [Cytophagales bacterium]|nr:alkyl hydroperoxide reductase [Cytophagales bacterium]HAA18286.1 alkyl hydroperoxide reductase [Cytophagales bacterium]HAP62002.1 alkyl hydroperoxide reductase [Cytophagales bacterium]